MSSRERLKKFYQKWGPIALDMSIIAVGSTILYLGGLYLLVKCAQVISSYTGPSDSQKIESVREEELPSDLQKIESIREEELERTLKAVSISSVERAIFDPQLMIVSSE